MPFTGHNIQCKDQLLVLFCFVFVAILRDKAVKKISPITDPRCPEGSRKLRFPDYVKIDQYGGKSRAS